MKGKNEFSENGNHEGKTKRSRTRKQKRHPLLEKIVLKVVIIILLAGLLCCGGYFGWQKFTEVQTERKHALVEQQLISCGELVTAKLKYSDIITIKKKTIFSKSYSIIKFSGIIRAGIPNIESATYKISDEGKRLEIDLPEAEILGNELVLQEVFDEQKSIFIPISAQEIFDEIENSMHIMTQKAVDDGTLVEARAQAEKIIRQVMIGCGFESVVFK